MKLTHTFFFVLIGFLTNCAVADLRPQSLRIAPPAQVMAEKGRALLTQAITTTGGEDAWEQVHGVQIDWLDTWYGVAGWLLQPWPENPMELNVFFGLQGQGSSATIKAGSQIGMKWSLRDGHTWESVPGSQPIAHQQESIRFILAAYQFFFELTSKVAGAPHVYWIDQRARDGRSYDLVFATWGPLESHDEDQFVLWIAQDTHRIEIVEYTIREKFSWLTGSNFFSDFRNVDGLVIPHTYEIKRHIDDEDLVHREHLENVRFVY